MTRRETALRAALEQLIKCLDYRRANGCTWMGEREALERARELLTAGTGPRRTEP